ncbi:MAG: DUF4410 domain-containing protein [Proteobacteria bacterium]|nr:DUF4410 domain-containing protein [Pseudomonadota bacterium]
MRSNICNLRVLAPLAACLISLAFLTGCSSKGHLTVSAPKTQSIPRGATASLTVKTVIRKANKFQDRIEQLLRKDVSSGLVAAGIFKAVSNTPTPTDYQIDIRINEMRVISTGQRLWLGAFSGRSFLKVQVNVNVHQTDPNRLITSFQADGYGARTAIGKQSYGYDDPVREVVSQVIQSLR